MLHRINTSRSKLNVMAGERSKQQTRSIRQMIHVDVDDLKGLATEENIRRLIARAILGLFIVCHRL